jgi:tRNA A37 threonylcarbamoyladenosine modification protein TsaB
LIGVPTLDIVAAGITPYEGNLMVVAEAGRLRLWTGHYRWQERGGWKVTGEPALSQWEQLLAELERPTLFAGEVSSEAAKQIRRNRLGRLVSPAATVRRAGYLAEIGAQRLKAGQVDDPRTLAPRYLRQPA